MTPAELAAALAPHLDVDRPVVGVGANSPEGEGVYLIDELPGLPGRPVVVVALLDLEQRAVREAAARGL